MSHTRTSDKLTEDGGPSDFCGFNVTPAKRISSVFFSLILCSVVSVKMWWRRRCLGIRALRSFWWWRSSGDTEDAWASVGTSYCRPKQKENLLWRRRLVDILRLCVILLKEEEEAGRGEDKQFGEHECDGYCSVTTTTTSSSSRKHEGHHHYKGEEGEGLEGERDSQFSSRKLWRRRK